VMKLRVVSSRNEIDVLDKNERMIHLAFRPSNVDFLNLIQSCPRLRVVQLPRSYHKTLSHAMQVFLDMQGIRVLQGDVWGHRKDLDAYFTVNDRTVNEIRTMAKGGLPIEEMADQLKERIRLGYDLIEYIVRVAS